MSGASRDRVNPAAGVSNHTPAYPPKTHPNPLAKTDYPTPPTT
ncbi:hypothetical protein SAMN04487939_11465 [Lysobacter sp. yr284]|nr:hypothetical protein SAMN04487939_11465 [Lysobacter sp. yr284]